MILGGLFILKDFFFKFRLTFTETYSHLVSVESDASIFSIGGYCAYSSTLVASAAFSLCFSSLNTGITFSDQYIFWRQHGCTLASYLGVPHKLFNCIEVVYFVFDIILLCGNTTTPAWLTETHPLSPLISTVFDLWQALAM